jgi:hypothetical protein
MYCFYGQCIFVPHDRKTVCCCPHENKNILTEEGSEKKITSTMKIHYLDRNISTLFIDLKNTLSLLKYFWICIKLMTLKKIIRMFSVDFNGNSAINYFTNTCNGFQVLKQKSAIAII